MRFAKALFVLAIAVCSSPLRAGADQPEHRGLSAVPFTAVKIQDEFWTPRIETNRRRSLPHNFAWCETTGRFSDFAKAAGLMEGEFEGLCWSDSEVYKVLEGASYSLADHPDPKLEQMVDEVIAKIAATQQENGYLNTYYTLVEPDKKWTDCRLKHELFCAGHLTEAAVAHYRATGKRTLLDVATRFVDRIDQIFGPNKRYDVPGHEEIELALVKLYQVTGEKRYLDLARFFLDIRGDESKREVYGKYCQDHVPVRQQSELVGHTVRAMYLYCGVADVAAYTGDEALIDAMHRLWEDLVQRKMYITGGLGARHLFESFGQPYELPNQSAYCETCTAIGLALWSHRLNLMHGDAQYADVLERVTYNGILAATGMDGEHFFYVNPLASGGGHHRHPFYECACCPPNVVRFVPQLPGYVYATGEGGVFVNLYAAGVARIARPDGKTIEIQQQTRYPWDGKVRISLKLSEPSKSFGQFQLNLRIPGWCEAAKLALNGEPIDPSPTVGGYAQICRYWDTGDVVELDLPMEVKRIEAHPWVTADAGRVAVGRGPIVYCFEGVDNPEGVRKIILARDPQLTAEYRPDLLGGVTVVEGLDRRGRRVTAVPYYAWDHREPGEMAVWVRQDGKSRTPDPDDPSWQGLLYRPLDPATLGPSEPLTLMDVTTISASHCECDHGIPRFTWWPKPGTRQWVQYEFEEPQKVSAVEVHWMKGNWFDDEAILHHCRPPASWKLLYEEDDAWKPVSGASAYGTQMNRYNRVTFEPVETAGLRIEVQVGPWPSGILEWKVE